MRAVSMEGWALKSKSGGGEVREAHPPGESVGLGGVDLDCEELFEELGVGVFVAGRGVECGGQRLGRGVSLR